VQASRIEQLHAAGQAERALDMQRRLDELLARRDGTSILPLLSGRELPRGQPLYWQFNYAPTEPAIALRQGDWKILARLSERTERAAASITDETNHTLKHAEPTGFELYNLKADIGETTDLAARQPQKLAELRELLVARFREVQGETPLWPAWEFPRFEGGRIEWPDYIAKPLPQPNAP
jgi:arylsulfatase A